MLASATRAYPAASVRSSSPHSAARSTIPPPRRVLAGLADGNFPRPGLPRTCLCHPCQPASGTGDDPRPARAVSCGAVADAYERGRPPYPPEAIDWLLPAGAARVLDVGAGTGKLPRQLAGRGLDVTAVEPSEGMRAQLRRAVPGVRALAGTAERIPLPDRSVAAVLVAPALHWVDPAAAVPEVARARGVPEGGGVLGRGGLRGLL